MGSGFWGGEETPSGQILFGTIGEENPRHPGLYSFRSTCGAAPNDVYVLSQDADKDGGGEFTRPRPGSQCVAVTTDNGGAAFVVGFQRTPRFDEESDDPPDASFPDDTKSGGDKAYLTAGGARLLLKLGGAVLIEAQDLVALNLNPSDKSMSARAKNMRFVADGYESRRGMADPASDGALDPTRSHRDRFSSQLGNSFDRVQISHGSLPGDRRRQLEVNGVTVAAATETSLTKYREYLDANGNWVGEGPTYRWGGADADEPIVLGLQLVAAFNELFDLISKLQVTTAVGPSTVPLAATQTALQTLRAKLEDQILSTFLFATKQPATLT